MNRPEPRRGQCIDRRAFLAASGLLAAGCRGAAPLPARSTAAPRTLRKAVGYGMIGEGATVLDKFLLARDLGFEGFEMDRPGGPPLDEVLRAQAASGVLVHGVVDSVHWSQTLNDPDASVRAAGIAGLEAALCDAAELGSSSVLLVPCVVDARRSYADAWRLSVEGIQRALPLAERLRVVIAVENVWNDFLLSPLEAARYVDELASPWLRFHFDIGNVVAYGWPEQWIEVLGERIVKLHVKDYSRRKRDEVGRWAGFDVELGEGDAGYSAVMRALDACGYSTAVPGRWATAEVGGGDRARLALIAEQMDRLFAS
jgi:hexulose-6-phosphate isomerase